MDKWGNVPHLPSLPLFSLLPFSYSLLLLPISLSTSQCLTNCMWSNLDIHWDYTCDITYVLHTTLLTLAFALATQALTEGNGCLENFRRYVCLHGSISSETSSFWSPFHGHNKLCGWKYWIAGNFRKRLNFGYIAGFQKFNLRNFYTITGEVNSFIRMDPTFWILDFWIFLPTALKWAFPNIYASKNFPLYGIGREFNLVDWWNAKFKSTKYSAFAVWYMWLRYPAPPSQDGLKSTYLKIGK